MTAAPGAPLRIANCSGFYGDRLSAMREVLEGGGVDVVTGDYLAELTMLILGKDRLKDPTRGYARTFAAQVTDCLALALERGVRIVANAGGLNPAGLAERLREVAAEQGLDARIAWVDGDDLAPRAAELGLDGALTANAYLGGFGIARALAAGADVVVTGRVTDASLVLGPAAWHHGWGPDDADGWDRFAGAVAAGHVVECGTQATGGNFSGFLDLPRTGRPLGFPIAEVAADGSSVITKHAGTGGAVTVDTVTAQLLYEVQGREYLGPDVTLDLASVVLEQEDVDRVRISGVRGSAPPARLKVCVNELGGWRNRVEFVLTGLDLEEKAAWLRDQLAPALTAAEVSWSSGRWPDPDADTEEGASVLLRCTVKDPAPEPVGKRFTAPAVELALASYPGFTLTGPPGAAAPYGVYRPAYVDRGVVTHTVHLPDGTVETVPDPTVLADPTSSVEPVETVDTGVGATAPTRRLPLGTVAHARSGDKGGDANVGVWARGEGHLRTARARWLADLLTPARVRELLPETASLDVEVVGLPNLHGVNVLVRGLLGDGVAASTRFDPQAKAVGEWLRARHVEIPEELL
ncbi:DUF1446 domain-containing protein [Nocardioides korecus]